MMRGGGGGARERLLFLSSYRLSLGALVLLGALGPRPVRECGSGLGWAGLGQGALEGARGSTPWQELCGFCPRRDTEVRAK